IGSLTFEAALRDCIERGDTVFDFTIGDEPYKRFFGAQPTAMWVISGPASPLGTLAGFVTRQMPWATQMAKRIINRKAFAERLAEGADGTSIPARGRPRHSPKSKLSLSRTAAIRL